MKEFCLQRGHVLLLGWTQSPARSCPADGLQNHHITVHITIQLVCLDLLLEERATSPCNMHFAKHCFYSEWVKS